VEIIYKHINGEREKRIFSSLYEKRQEKLPGITQALCMRETERERERERERARDPDIRK
jgi:hypothetical protein